MARAPDILKKYWLAVLVVLVLALGIAGAATYPRWRADLLSWLGGSQAEESDAAGQPGRRGHIHAGHAEVMSIHLSESGLKNIGYRPLTVELGEFIRTVTLPAMVVERPGRSQIHITAPLTGVVTKIYPIQGAAVEPGSPMFDVRLTHEELVAAQREYVRTAESLDVVNREIARLESLTEGVVARKRILEQQYEKQKLEAVLQAERQSLLLHGLSEEQVDAILEKRELFQWLTVRAPTHSAENEACEEDHLFHVQELPVKLGQQVETGQLLCVLADHCELYVEGRAFADDADRLREAARENWTVDAKLLAGDRAAARIDELTLLYLADHVDPQSRAFHFYLSLPNEVVLDQAGASGDRFIEWRFKPGQRMELQVPIERWEDRIVVPIEAVVEEAAESYVYRQNGDHFDRVSVHVEYRGPTTAVIANDGLLFPGDVIAARGAYQMHLALKNKSGGGIDPHAGHSH